MPIYQPTQPGYDRLYDGSVTIEDLLGRLTDDGRIIHVERFDERPPRYRDLDADLHPVVADALGDRRLFTHQAQAVELLRAGRSVAIATATASGKSLCYQLPIADAAAASNGRATALMMFPTKALAQDQLRSLAGLGVEPIQAATFDGDTPWESRRFVRNRSNVILTNPEMLHNSILPNHGRWAAFIRRLRYVVIDELHVLRGVFGTHVSHLLRRLIRVARHYGSEPTFAFTSATIGDPARLAAELCGLDVVAVDDDGSPQGPRSFALLNPPLVDEASGARTSTTSETASTVAALVAAEHRTIAFAQSRKGTELIAGDVGRRVPEAHRGAIRSYRGGYLAAERRQIEHELATGEVMAVVATNALELGVDIGDLDACVLSGFPGTIASMWQQAGRAGRSGQSSLTVLVAGDDQLDQWLMAHPDQVFSRPPEPAVINVTNPYIVLPHLACAAHELPLGHNDHQYWPETLDEGVRQLVLDDLCVVRSTGDGPLALWSGLGNPGRGIGLRSGSSAEFSIVDSNGTLIGTVDESRAPRLVHQGAIYLHRGETWRVVEYHPDDLVAVVESDPGESYTQPRSTTTISVLGEPEQTQPVGALDLMLGRVQVTHQVTGYQVRERRSRRVVAHHDLDVAPEQLVTRAFWYTADGATIARTGIASADLAGGLHAAEHAMIGMLPLFTICDRWDVGGVSTALHADTGQATIFVYDGYPGGTGIAELGYEVADRHVAATLASLKACGCESGCPSCVVSPKCGNGNEPLDKAAAIAILETAG